MVINTILLLVASTSLDYLTTSLQNGALFRWPSGCKGYEPRMDSCWTLEDLEPDAHLRNCSGGLSKKQLVPDKV